MYSTATVNNTTSGSATIRNVQDLLSYPGVPGEQVGRVEVSRRKGKEERGCGGEDKGEEGGSSLTHRETESVFMVASETHRLCVIDNL